jgi:hypothetical protein
MKEHRTDNSTLASVFENKNRTPSYKTLCGILRTRPKDINNGNKS